MKTENLSNLLSNREALNYVSTFSMFFPSQNNGLEEFLFPKREENPKVSKQKEQIQNSNTVQYNTTNSKKLRSSYKLINKKCHDKIYSDCE